MRSYCGSWASRNDAGVNIDALLHHYGLLAIFLGSGLEGETVVVAGGILAHQQFVSLPGAMAAAVTGSFLVDQLYFLLGRRFRDHRWVAGIRTKPAFGRALAMLEAHPVGFIFSFRFLYGLRTISPIAIGTSRVAARTFLVVNAVSAIVWGIAFTTIGYLFGHAFERFLGRLIPKGEVLWIALGIVAVIAAAAFALHRWRTRPT